MGGGGWGEDGTEQKHGKMGAGCGGSALWKKRKWLLGTRIVNVSACKNTS